MRMRLGHPGHQSGACGIDGGDAARGDGADAARHARDAIALDQHFAGVGLRPRAVEDPDVAEQHIRHGVNPPQTQRESRLAAALASSTPCGQCLRPRTPIRGILVTASRKTASRAAARVHFGLNYSSAEWLRLNSNSALTNPTTAGGFGLDPPWSEGAIRSLENACDPVGVGSLPAPSAREQLQMSAMGGQQRLSTTLSARSALPSAAELLADLHDCRLVPQAVI